MLETIGFLLVAALLLAIVKHELQRKGQRFVRAFIFLSALDKGYDIKAANKLAAKSLTLRSDPVTDHAAISAAIKMKEEAFKGKQLPMIRLARGMGFKD